MQFTEGGALCFFVHKMLVIQVTCTNTEDIISDFKVAVVDSGAVRRYLPLSLIIECNLREEF